MHADGGKFFLFWDITKKVSRSIVFFPLVSHLTQRPSPTHSSTHNTEDFNVDPAKVLVLPERGYIKVPKLSFDKSSVTSYF